MAGISRLTLLLLALACLCACGEGYAVDEARLNLTDATAASAKELQDVASSYLAQEGFEDLGRDEQMIDLLKRGSTPKDVVDPTIDQLTRTRTYLAEDRDLRVELADYSDGARSPFANETPPTPNLIEIRISEARPGGASPQAHAFYLRFVGVLRARFGDRIVEVEGLPPDNEAEHQRITRPNQIGAVTSWCVAFSAGILVTGSLSLFLLRRTKLPIAARRLIFIAANVWLATPVVLPAAFIMVLPAPNLLAFPWTNPELFSGGAPFHPVSFLSAFLLCSGAAFLLIRDRPKRSAPIPALEQRG